MAVDALGTLQLDLSRAALAAELGDALTTTASQAPVTSVGQRYTGSGGGVLPQTAQSGPLINLDDFQNDPRFAGVDGSGFAAVILDTGIDLDHPFFGPDLDFNGVADRIVYNQDFTGSDPNAQDINGHGSNVSSIIASQDITYPGVAPGVDIISLQVLDDAGFGNFGDIEAALQWVVANTATYNIASVNMSLSDGSNRQVAVGDFGLDDELAALAALDVIVVSAAGNSFFGNASVPGVAYPAADPNSLAVGAVWDGNNGGLFQWGSGAIDFSTDADRITSFSQRDSILTDIFAPGALITGADAVGGLSTFAGTSQASPQIAGVAVLAQQLADQAIGRRLTNQEFTDLLRDTAVTINDGDDEDDNVINTGANFGRVDMFALAEAIEALGKIHVVSSSPAENGLVTSQVTDFVIDFSVPYSPASIQAADFTVNAIAADSVVQTDSDTLTFSFVASPIVAQGLQSMQIAAGAIADVSLAPIDQYDAAFRWDAIPMQVVGSVPTANTTVALPLTTIRFDLNEPFEVSSLDVNDLALSVGTVTGVVPIDADTVEYTVSGLNVEGTLTAQLVEGALNDTFGNPSAEFTSVYTLDFGTSIVGSLLPIANAIGSLQVQQTFSGKIQAIGDVDTFTLALEANQSITVTVVGDATLQPTISILDPNAILQGSSVSVAPGTPAIVQSLATNVAGTYSVQVSSIAATIGDYELVLIVNGDAELETLGLATNDTLATAQNLDNSFIELEPGASRSLVSGDIEGDVVKVGPDQFGYEALVVPFEFNDISATGTAVLTGSDNSTVMLNATDLVGFSFDFYGTTYGSAFITSNGLINFFAPDTSPNNSDLTQSPILPTVAALWDDLIISGTANSNVFWEVQGSGNSQELVVQWNEVRFVGAGSSDVITFQAVLRENDDSIQFNYLDLDATHSGSGGASATVGIKDLNFQIPGQSDNRLLISQDAGPNAFVDTGVSLKIGVGIVPVPQPDYYAVSLLAGDLLSVAATSEQRGTLSLELRDATDTVVQTAIAADNVDAVIDGYVVPVDGTYYVRINGATATDYSVLVTRNAAFDTEANDDLGLAQDITATGVAFGSIGFGSTASTAAGTPVSGPFDILASPISLGFASDGSFVGSTIGAIHNGVEFLNFGTALAAYSVAFDGATFTNGNPATGTDFAVTLEDISSGAQNGVRIRGTIVTGVEFERVVLWNDGDDYALVTTSVTNNTGATLNNVALLENQDPDPGGDVITANDVLDGGDLVIAGSSFNGVLGLGSLDPRAVVSVEGNLVTDPFAVLNSPQDPNGQTADLSVNLAFDLGALLPGARREASFVMAMGPSISAVEQTFSQASLDTLFESDDYFSVSLTAGQGIVISTTTPGDATAQGINGLDPAIELYDPLGALVGSDFNSASDGKNTLLTYTAATSGVFTVRVFPETNTQGEYVLVVNQSPTATINGPATGVPYQPRTFTLTATDPNAIDQAGNFTFTIDWDGNGQLDQVVVGPSGTQVTTSFSTLGDADIRVSATDARGVTGPESQSSISIARQELQSDPLLPGVFNLAFGGTAGNDQVLFSETGFETVTLTTVVLNGVLQNTIEVFAGVSGRVVAYAGPGDDSIVGLFLENIGIDADGGGDQDVLLGGNADDVIIGGDGDDSLVGGDGDDTLWADSVDGSEGATGNDLVYGGDGDDLIVGDGSEGGDDSLYGNDGNDTILSGGGDDFVDGGEDDDKIYGGDGAEGSTDQLFGGEGDDYIEGGVGPDLIDGGAGRDLLVTGNSATLQVLGDTVLGGDGDDIVVAGALLFAIDDLNDAVDAIMAEWTSNRDYATRVNNISGTGLGPRANGNYFLQVGLTVDSNQVADDLTGGNELDWFLYTLAQDILNDPEAGEVLTDLP